MSNNVQLRLSFRRASALALAFVALTLPSCVGRGGGHFELFGYSTRPNFDTNVKTVRVPILKNLSYWQGIEFELTKALVREIEQKTPYKVVSCDSAADTELTGTVINLSKTVINRTQLNEIREAQTVLAVEVVWKDLRTGDVLSRPLTIRPPPGIEGVIPGNDTTLGAAPNPADLPTSLLPPPPPLPVLVQSKASFIPEIGESITSARKKNVDSLAAQIVQLMEKPWELPCKNGVPATAPSASSGQP